jgi:hypothetical protein
MEQDETQFNFERPNLTKTVDYINETQTHFTSTPNSNPNIINPNMPNFQANYKSLLPNGEINGQFQIDFNNNFNKIINGNMPRQNIRYS